VPTRPRENDRSWPQLHLDLCQKVSTAFLLLTPTREGQHEEDDNGCSRSVRAVDRRFIVSGPNLRRLVWRGWFFILGNRSC
jgi:hypothetical protein